MAYGILDGNHSFASQTFLVARIFSRQKAWSRCGQTVGAHKARVHEKLGQRKVRLISLIGGSHALSHAELRKG